ncbi:hypothetical protein P692DRAFT_20522430 [Suillus brevipes Sb2]|nr:hypothetical protein P692DRAFT_20522430 [Suillus brevipes Sb2]
MTCLTSTTRHIMKTDLSYLVAVISQLVHYHMALFHISLHMASFASYRHFPCLCFLVISCYRYKPSRMHFGPLYILIDAVIAVP